MSELDPRAASLICRTISLQQRGVTDEADSLGLIVATALAATGRVHWHGTCGDCRHWSGLVLPDGGTPWCEEWDAARDGDDHCKEWTERSR